MSEYVTWGVGLVALFSPIWLPLLYFKRLRPRIHKSRCGKVEKSLIWGLSLYPGFIAGGHAGMPFPGLASFIIMASVGNIDRSVINFNMASFAIVTVLAFAVVWITARLKG